MLQHSASFRNNSGKSNVQNSSLFGEDRKGKKRDPRKPDICYIRTFTMVHKKTVEGIYSNSLGCSIRVIVQSGFAPSVNSLWNLKNERQ